MNIVKDLGEILSPRPLTSGVVKQVGKGKVTIMTNRGAVITAHNPGAGYAVGDRVSLQDGVIVERLSSSDDRPVYLV